MSAPLLLLVAALAVAFLLLLVMRLRMHAFVALLAASVFVAVAGGVPLRDVARTIQDGMGGTLGFIALVVGLGAMFGELLAVSGGADGLARALIRVCGEKRAPWALGLTGFLVSIPVFFDVGLIILLPLARGLSRRTGKSLLCYALPLGAGLAIGHSFVPPTPGPVAVAAMLKADLGWVILFGSICGLVALAGGGFWFCARAADRIGTMAGDAGGAWPAGEDDKPENHQTIRAPGVAVVVGLILLPLVLILLHTATTAALPERHFARDFFALAGHPFFALLLTVVLSFVFLGTRCGFSRQQVREIASRSLEPVGLILLVTGAGGVLGKTLVATGVGKALADGLATTHLPLMALAFLIAVLVRVSQGSATVAMVTAAGLVQPVVEAVPVSQPRLALLVVAIASGATVLSHVNDSGFWLVSRYLGLSERDTLRSWTVLETILGGVGFLAALGLSWVVP